MSFELSQLAEKVDEDVRLIILRALSMSVDGRLNETIIHETLDAFAHKRSRDYVRAQMHKLADIGAVILARTGSIDIATITEAGIEHVERRAFLPGIRRPSIRG